MGRAMPAQALPAQVERDDVAALEPRRERGKASRMIHPAVQRQDRKTVLGPPGAPRDTQPVSVPMALSRRSRLCHVPHPPAWFALQKT